MSAWWLLWLLVIPAGAYLKWGLMPCSIAFEIGRRAERIRALKREQAKDRHPSSAGSAR